MRKQYMDDSKSSSNKDDVRVFRVAVPKRVTKTSANIITQTTQENLNTKSKMAPIGNNEEDSITDFCLSFENVDNGVRNSEYLLEPIVSNKNDTFKKHSIQINERVLEHFKEYCEMFEVTIGSSASEALDLWMCEKLFMNLKNSAVNAISIYVLSEHESFLSDLIDDLKLTYGTDYRLISAPRLVIDTRTAILDTYYRNKIQLLNLDSSVVWVLIEKLIKRVGTYKAVLYEKTLLGYNIDRSYLYHYMSQHISILDLIETPLTISTGARK